MDSQSVLFQAINQRFHYRRGTNFRILRILLPFEVIFVSQLVIIAESKVICIR